MLDDTDFTAVAPSGQNLDQAGDKQELIRSTCEPAGRQRTAQMPQSECAHLRCGARHEVDPPIRSSKVTSCDCAMGMRLKVSAASFT
jgi:hypothetical protein